MPARCLPYLAYIAYHPTTYRQFGIFVLVAIGLCSLERAFAPGRPRSWRLVLVHDAVAEIGAFVADEQRRTGDQLVDVVLALAAERAVERRGEAPCQPQSAPKDLCQYSAQVIELAAECRQLRFNAAEAFVAHQCGGHRCNAPNSRMSNAAPTEPVQIFRSRSSRSIELLVTSSSFSKSVL